MSDDHDLLAAAAEVAERAYAPYSRFRVGAVAVDDDGNRYAGANVENAAYGGTMCAEAVAIGHAVTSGARALEVVAVACLDAAGPCFPCGNCRQLMREFGVAHVLVASGDGTPRRYGLDELLPNSFGPEDLP